MAARKNHTVTHIVAGSRPWKRYSRKVRMIKRVTSSLSFFLAIGAFVLFFTLYFSRI